MAQQSRVLEKDMDETQRPDFESLFDFYLARGCPCRFPRFRAAVARDLKEVGAGDWGSPDTSALLKYFGERVELDVSHRETYMTIGTCRRCGAQVKRDAYEVFRDSFLEVASITRGALPDLGADVHGVVPICMPLFLAAPISLTPNERRRIQNSYPRLSPNDWLEYMRALSDD
jgi:hypothetical protein